MKFPQPVCISSVLALWQTHHHALQIRRYLDLTAQAAALIDIESKIKHIAFQFLDRIALFGPFLRNIDMARRTGACAAAIACNALGRFAS